MTAKSSPDTGLINLTDKGEALLSKVGQKDIDIAWERFWILFPDKDPHPEVKKTVSSGMKSRWLRKYKQGIELYGDGVLGLVPLYYKRGNRLSKERTPENAVRGKPSRAAGVRQTVADQSDVRHLPTGTVVRKGNVTIHTMS